jgi:hypothetical protein
MATNLAVHEIEMLVDYDLNFHKKMEVRMQGQL